jgi:hypothetical protein
VPPFRDLPQWAVDDAGDGESRRQVELGAGIPFRRYADIGHPYGVPYIRECRIIDSEYYTEASMKPLSMLAVCVMLLSSCATKQDAEQSQQLSEASPPGIPGLTWKAVTDRIRREMVTSDGWDSARRHMTMTSYADGLDFNVTIRGPRPEGADAIMQDMKKLGPDAMARLDSLQAASPIDTVVAELRANPELSSSSFAPHRSTNAC